MNQWAIFIVRNLITYYKRLIYQNIDLSFRRRFCSSPMHLDVGVSDVISLCFIYSQYLIWCTKSWSCQPGRICRNLWCLYNSYSGGLLITSGEGTPILGHDREVTWRWPLLLRFFIPYFIPHRALIDPLVLQKKISLSLSHLVPEILGPKFGLMLH